MKNKIALTAIIVALATNVAFAYTFDDNDTTGDCKAPDILETAGTLAGTDPVQYKASWDNKTYTIQFNNADGTAGTRTDSPALTCTYYDAADMADGNITKTNCALASTGTMYKTGSVLTSWETTSGASIALSDAAPLNTLSTADLSAADSNSDTVVLEAVYTPCQYQYAGTTQPSYVTITASNTTNVCQYTVSCGNGYRLHTAGTGYGTNGVYQYDTYGSNTNPLIVNIPADACVGNEIQLQWDTNGGTTTANGSNTCTYGVDDDITLPTMNPSSRPGYVFKGWDIVD